MEGPERDGRAPGALRGGEMECVQRADAGHLRDRGRYLAGFGIELDQRQSLRVPHERGPSLAGIAVGQDPCQVAADLDDRVTRGEQRGVAAKQRVGSI